MTGFAIGPKDHHSGIFTERDTIVDRKQRDLSVQEVFASDVEVQRVSAMCFGSTSPPKLCALVYRRVRDLTVSGPGFCGLEESATARVRRRWVAL